MDNISHSVAGLVVGEIIHRSLPELSDPDHERVRRRLILITCCVASNFPDLDLVLTPLLPPPLGYLLHHRGHTHTILYAFPQALLLFGLIAGLWPAARRLLRNDAAARKGVGLSLLVGFALHLLMDYLNSYGIHPFHPIDSRWFFGDMVFIIEPFFWVAFGVPMAMLVGRAWLRTVFLALLFGLPVVFAAVGFLPWYSALVLWATGLGLAGFQRKSPPRSTRSLVLAAMLGLGFVGLQSFASGQAKRAIKVALADKDGESAILDSAASSYPTNPLCWTFISIESNETKGVYKLRRGILSLAPDFLRAEECPKTLSAGLTAVEVTPRIVYHSEETDRLADLRRLKAENCHFEAWLRFARAPHVTDEEALDLRFSSARMRGNFTTMKFKDFEGRDCPGLVPLWSFPRADLLSPNDNKTPPNR